MEYNKVLSIYKKYLNDINLDIDLTSENYIILIKENYDYLILENQIKEIELTDITDTHYNDLKELADKLKDLNYELAGFKLNQSNYNRKTGMYQSFSEKDYIFS